MENNFKQVVVWPGVIIGSDIQGFEDFIKAELDIRVKFIEEIITEPDYYYNSTGGRHDVFFYIHDEDIMKFAIPRFKYGMRWIEDVLDNEIHLNKENEIPENYSIYPVHVKKYRTW